ncbi:uncharacterized protein Z520_04805 [Fonsecaea multimorphosa CBS 102226]|uniref:F-box domain-containing protein n=1 Tax=Fonsecaea multimorphosa CBS 102226 TaxID=1442371 RepID=A0A0D2K7S6_9EURO|nr:uncharacterized protein Z520_04805 [Fonsecaea multimorphosa CBS 102226]KIX99229.1 hypothetical protein Z520_04805 [Fonsecaea multimorphosa CBS 102226]OAL25925.1 hypothetical protein AYO22_04552 [Fonsecaea multimorphosa]
MAQSSTLARPRRAPRVRYPNDDSDTDDLPEFTLNPRPSRAARRIQTYRESSEDDNDDRLDLSSDESDSQSSSDQSSVQPQRGARSQLPTQRQSWPPKRKAEAQRLLKTNKRQKTSSANKKQSQMNAKGVTKTYRQQKPSSSTNSRSQMNAKGVTKTYRQQKSSSSANHRSQMNAKRSVDLPFAFNTARIPPWQQLPYHVLVSIMQYAAYPLYGPTSRAQPSINWLCEVGTLCRTFHEACTAALLYSPPLYPSWRAHCLMGLLAQPPEELSTDYRRKIHFLDIEVKQLLVRTSGISMDRLISMTPQLQGLRLYSNYDDLTTVIWAQPAAKKFKWSYPTELFERLETDNLFMRSFEWNGRFPNAMDVLKVAVKAHCRPSFSRLRDLTFLNLTLPEKAKETDVISAQSLLAGVLSSVPELQFLSLRNCGIVDEVTMPTLPPGLLHLELANCPGLTSDALEGYLTRASSLRVLKLDGNQSMDLGFIANLQSLCPHLQHLEIDMLYIDPTSFRDREPLYDELLPNGPPTWPTDLASISIENMRQLTQDDAEEFLASLVESSERLPHLRRLNIKAILKGASWRDRASFRQRWLPKLENVFLNTEEPSNVGNKFSKKAPSTSQRQSSRIANGHLKKLSLSDTTDESDAPAANAIHGRCDVVNLVISDQRPAETQYHENDFLDSEPSDDGEWRGDSQQVL